MVNPLPNAALFYESELYKCITLREVLPPLDVFISVIISWVQNHNESN